MVDCGAFTGDTIREFKRRICNENWRVYAFEPDSYNYRQLNSLLSRSRYYARHVMTYNIATWSSKCKLYFDDKMGDSSRVSRNKHKWTKIIDANTIDDVLKDEKVTFIKMDVEGAELESLKGAKEIISRDHPRLAISIYHSDSDMINIIKYLRDEYPFYRLYIRHYTWGFTDTICYAVDPQYYKTYIDV